jgi:hypothetical protein
MKSNSFWLKAIFLLALGFSGIALILNSWPVNDASWLSGWSNRVKLTIDHTKIDASLANFPVLVHLSPSSGLNSADVSSIFSMLGSNNKKIAFTTSDGVTQCYAEIEKWDAANRQAYLWVKVPSISSSVDTEMYLYFDNNHADNLDMVGNTGSTAAQNVWDSGFVSVDHLAEVGSGVSGEFKDSTAKHHDGTGHGSSGTPARIDTPMGYGQHFDGSNDYIVIPDHNDFSMLTTGDLTISFWFSTDVLDNPTADYSGGEYAQHIVQKGQSGNYEWTFVFHNRTGSYSQRMSFYIWNPDGGQEIGRAHV